MKSELSQKIKAKTLVTRIVILKLDPTCVSWPHEYAGKNLNRVFYKHLESAMKLTHKVHLMDGANKNRIIYTISQHIRFIKSGKFARSPHS